MAITLCPSTLQVYPLLHFEKRSNEILDKSKLLSIDLDKFYITDASISPKLITENDSPAVQSSLGEQMMKSNTNGDVNHALPSTFRASTAVNPESRSIDKEIPGKLKDYNK